MQHIIIRDRGPYHGGIAKDDDCRRHDLLRVAKHPQRTQCARDAGPNNKHFRWGGVSDDEIVNNGQARLVDALRVRVAVQEPNNQERDLYAATTCTTEECQGQTHLYATKHPTQRMVDITGGRTCMSPALFASLTDKPKMALRPELTASCMPMCWTRHSSMAGKVGMRGACALSTKSTAS